MIYREVTLSDFRDEFKRAGRETQFSYEGLAALYEHLNKVYDLYRLDVIALCCEYSEMELDEALEDYNRKDISDLEDSVRVILEVNNTTVIVGE